MTKKQQSFTTLFQDNQSEPVP